MRTVRILLLTLLLFHTVTSFADEFSDWQGYPPFVTINDLAEHEGLIYGATKGGLFRYDPLTQNYTEYFKGRGLPNNNVTAVAATSDALYLGFEEDGLWRFEFETETFKQVLFPEYHIKTSENPAGIAINDILVSNDDIIYVAHASGIDRLDLANNGIKAYTNLGADFPENLAVTRVRIIDDILYACTNIGLATAEETDPNLEFSNRWNNYQSVGTSIYGVSDVTKISGRVLAASNSIHVFFVNTDQNTLDNYAKVKNNYFIRSFATISDGRTLVAANKKNDYTYNGSLYQLAGTGLFDIDASYTDIATMLPGSDGKLWIGTVLNGLQCYTDLGYIDIPKTSELRNNNFYSLALGRNDVIWTACAYRDVSLLSTFQRFDGETWSNYPNSFFSPSYRVVSTFVDSGDTVWLATWGKGVYIVNDDGSAEIENDSFVHVDDEKVIIKPTLERGTVYATDFREDKHGNVWIANFMHPPGEIKVEPIASSGAVVVDGYPITKFKQYSPAYEGLPTAFIYQICPDDDGWVWLGTHAEGVVGLFVGDDPFDKRDFDNNKHVKKLKTEQGILSTRIAAIDFDQNGDVWVGSAGGLNRIEKDGLDLTVTDENEILSTSSTSTITAIKIDQFNNKWIGTEGGGLVKINADNEVEEIYLTSNSGIFSNFILSLNYDDSKDVLWIGTATGLNRFDVFADVIESADLDVRVYPNPFEIWGYDSRATFPGLESGSSIKIYSFNGDLLNEAASESSSGNGGASASWDGRNFDGNYVGTGVYFFTGTALDGHTFKDKMVVIRR